MTEITRKTKLTCEEIAKIARENWSAEQLLSHPAFNRIRFKTWGFGEKVLEKFTIYFNCSDSPSGVYRAGGGDRKDLPAGAKGSHGPAHGDIAAKQWGI